MYKSPYSVPRFTNAKIVTYFVTRTVSDGLKSSNFKAINQSAMNLFLCGHVQEIQASQNKEALFLKAKYLPEMKKDRCISY